MINNWHHVRFYFFFFATLGLISPYFGWWLSSVMRPENIKYGLAAFYATQIIAPSLWGHIAFSGSKPGAWLSHGTLLATLFALGLSQVDINTNVGAASIIILAFGVFYNPILPLLETMAYAQVGDHTVYSKIRLFGSLGFLLCSTLIGSMILMDKPSLFPITVALLMCATWLFSLPYKNNKFMTFEMSIEEKNKSSNPISQLVTPNDFKSVVKSLSPLSGLWILTGLTQAAFACYYAFFALHMKSIGVSSFAIGIMIGISVAAEVFAFWKMSWFFKRSGPWALLIFSTAFSLARWIILSFASPNLAPLIMVMQIGHAFGFSVFHTSCLKIINDRVTSSHLGAAQGFYNAVGYGIGGIIGVFVSGILWVEYGGYGIFAFASFLSFLALLVSLVLYFKEKKKYTSDILTNN